MGIFGFKRQTEKTGETRKAVSATNTKKSVETKAPKIKKEKAVVAVSVPTGSFGDSAGSIIRPYVTEKSGLMSRDGIYTFQVAKNSNKSLISSAIKSLYKVTPVKVSIVNLPAKNVFVRGKRGVVPGLKKAIVTLKKGDKIDFV
jgi:large subunit ribosomal protein L23